MGVEPSWTPRGGLNRDMGLLPSQQLVDLDQPTPCLVLLQLMVQLQLASSLPGCISLPQLLGQPAHKHEAHTQSVKGTLSLTGDGLLQQVWAE